MFKRTHDYYHQVTGQLALTGTQFGDFIVWTKVDVHIKRIYFNTELWENIKPKLAHFLSHMSQIRNFGTLM